MGTPENLALETWREGSVLVARVVGEVDASNADRLASALSQLEGPTVVDLTQLAYIDSAGIRALDEGLSRLVSSGGAYRTVAPEGSPARLTLRVSGYDLAYVADDLPSALLDIQA
jgi:anti-anti-sigma factor